MKSESVIQYERKAIQLSNNQYVSDGSAYADCDMDLVNQARNIFKL